MAVLEREVRKMKNGNVLVPRSISFKGGAVKIENVPHLEKREDGFVEYFLPGSVSLKISAIAEFMEEENINCFNFMELEKYPQIEDLYL